MIQSGISYVFHRAALLEWRIVRKNIPLQGEMRGMNKKAAADKADQLIEMTGLTGFENALPHELSGGMQPCVSLCRATARTRSAADGRALRRPRSPHPREDERRTVMSPRPRRIVDILDVDLPAHREYSATMERPEFISVANTVRDLLGATTRAD